MKSVCLAVPPVDDLYPWLHATAGLKKLGFAVFGGVYVEADVLVTWSPWHGSRRQALEGAYRSAGKPVIVMENGWLAPPPPPSAMEHRPTHFQIACDGWNGTGTFPAGDGSRWARWNVPLQPWRTRDDGYALVIGQRGHPTDDRTAVPGWHERLGPLSRPIVRRARDAARSLAADLTGASEVHVWTSNAASHAVVAGIPVVHHGPNLMVSALASRPGAPLFRGDRLPELERLAWAQWNAAEIATGEPFARLLGA